MARVAVVTGGSRGLGFAIAQELQRRGYDLLLAAGGEDKLKEAQAQLNGGTRVEYAAGDLTDERNAARLAEMCRYQFGRLDLLVNNAGVFLGGSLEEFGKSDWDKIIGVNLTAPYLVTRATLDLLRESKAQIIFINSVGGKTGLTNLCGYSASKHGLRGFADSMRLELKPHGIRVTSIYPHGMNSGGDQIEENTAERFQKIETADVARMVGEVADAPLHLQVPEIVLYPRSTEIGKRERAKELLE